MISFESVTKRFPDGTTAVDNLDLEVPEGDLTVLVGPSGCGKTTTLRMINRMIEASSGRIVVDGQDIAKVDPPELRRRIGYVIQQIGLFPHRTIGENIATVPELIGWDKRRTRGRVGELLELVGLPAEVRDRYPHQLSGGQRQRVGVARALAVDPPIMLMDEPFGAVDPIVRSRLQDEFLRLQQEVRKTIVFVTHDIDEAIKMGDRIAIFRQGGHLEQYAPPDELLAEPATDFVADFLGAERGLKRLALIPVSAVKAESGPVVSPDDDGQAGPGRGRGLRQRLGGGGGRRPAAARLGPRRRGGRAGPGRRGRDPPLPAPGPGRGLAAGRPQRHGPVAHRGGRAGQRRRPLRGHRHPGAALQGDQLTDGPVPVLAAELIRWSWVGDHLDDIRDYLIQHVQLTVLAVLFGLLLAFPLALVAIRWPRTYGPVLGFTGILFTIPSLALFILLIPFTGLSVRTSLIGLTMYTLLILVRNIVEGLRGVDRDVREAAQAMGYTRARQLFQVELPLALPVIMAGIRIATVTTIGLVTITALIGQGGLGQLFIDGFTLNFATPIVVGIVLSALLAFAADLALVGLQHRLTPWARSRGR